jgi:ribonuclease Z
MNTFFASITHTLVGNRVLQARAVRAQLAAEWLNDGGLHVILPGTGSPLADNTRAGPCAVVIAGGEYLIIDVGQRSFNRQSTMGLPTDHLTGILLTHFHSDHICELGETLTMHWAQSGRQSRLPVYGPPGVDKVVAGFTMAYSQDSVYREVHHGVDAIRSGKGTGANMPRYNSAGEAITIPIPGGSSDSMDSTVVFERNGLKVIAFNVDHRPVLPAYGYRFEYNGRVAVVSGDTCKCDQLIKYSKGADILVSEASSCHVLHTIIDTLKNAPKHDHGAQRTSYLVEDVIDYHIDVQDVVDIASTCQVPVLALTHLVPPPSDSWILLKMWLSKLNVPASWNGRLIVGRDGDTFHLPSSPSKKIVTTNLVHGKWENIKKLGKVVLFGVLAWLFIKSRSRL